MLREFPKVLFVQRPIEPESIWKGSGDHKNIDRHGEVIGVYELRRVCRTIVKKTVTLAEENLLDEGAI